MVTGLLFLGEFVSINIFGLIGVIISCIFATVISTLLITCLGLFAFYMEDANPLYWIYSKFILVLGTIFPIEYFPKVLQPIINLSPIYAVSYGPAKLFVDFSLSNFFVVIFAQIIYIGIGYLLCSILYKKGVKRLNVNGG